MRKQLVFSAALVCILLFLDQLIKLYIKINFAPGEFQPLIGNWFILHYTENPGMAFGQTFGASIWAKLFLSLFRIAAIIVIVRYLFAMHRA